MQIATKLTEEQIAEARQYRMGLSALELLDYVQDGKLITASFWRKDIVGFFSMKAGYLENPSFSWMNRSENVLEALLKRDFVAEVNSGLMKSTWKRAHKNSGKKHHFPTETCYQITTAGLQAMIASKAELGRKQAEKEDYKTNPRYAISKRMGKPGVGFLYLVLKERSGRVYLAEQVGENRTDQAVYRTSTGQQYLEEEMVAVSRATVEQYAYLKDLTEQYDRRIQEEEQRLQATLAPFIQKSKNTRENWKEELETNVQNSANTFNELEEEGVLLDEDDIKGMGL